MMPNVVRSAHAQQSGYRYSVPTELANDLEKAVTLIANGATMPSSAEFEVDGAREAAAAIVSMSNSVPTPLPAHRVLAKA